MGFDKLINPKLFPIVGAILIVGLLVQGFFIYSLKTEINSLTATSESGDELLSKKMDSLNEILVGDIQNLSNKIDSNKERIDDLTGTVEDVGAQVESGLNSAAGISPEMLSKIYRGVVSIESEETYGSGFFISDSGYIVTNAHVLDAHSNHVKIYTYDKQELEGRVVERNNDKDVALIKLDPVSAASYKNFTSLVLIVNSDSLVVGDKVWAIGSPFGLEYSVSQGIISGLDREAIRDLKAYIQTDAALNPGNSGGPLVNRAGFVVGINNFKISGDNLGFALEANYIRGLVQELYNEGKEGDFPWRYSY